MVQAPDMEGRHGVKQVLEAWRTAYSAEGVRFGIDEGTVEAFLAKRGFRLLEHLGPDEMEKKYLTLRDGSRAGRVVALFGLAQASVEA